MSKQTIFQKKPLAPSSGVTITYRECRRCRRVIPTVAERCVCLSMYELREHMESMDSHSRFQIMCETMNGYCGYCGDKLKELSNGSGGSTVGSYEACHCTNDE